MERKRVVVARHLLGKCASFLGFMRFMGSLFAAFSLGLLVRPTQLSHTFPPCQIPVAAERRKKVAHGASRGIDVRTAKPRQGRQTPGMNLTDKTPGIGYISTMSFNEVLEELPALTVEQRQLLIRRALELDEPPLAPEDEAIVQERLGAHHQNPTSSVPVDTMKAKLRSRPAK